MSYMVEYEKVNINFSNNNYEINNTLSDKSIEEYIVGYLYDLNKHMYGKNRLLSVMQLKNNNLHLLIFEKYILLFVTYGIKYREENFVNNMYGFKINSSHINVFWQYIDVFISLLHSNEYNALNHVGILSEENMRKIEKFDFNNTYSKSLNTLISRLKDSKIIESFWLSPIPTNIINVKNYTNEISDICRCPQKIFDEELFMVSNFSALDNGAKLAYRIISMKDRPHKDGYFAEKKIIKEKAKRSKHIWYIKYDKKNTKELEQFSEGEILDFDSII